MKEGSVRFSKILILMISAYLVMLWLVFGLVGDSASVDLVSTLLGTAIGGSLIVFLLLPSRETRPVMIMLVMTTFIYISVRLPFLILVPESWKFIVRVPLPSTNLNWGMLFIGIGVLACAQGVWLSSPSRPRKFESNDVPEARTPVPSPIVAALVAVSVLVIETFEYWRLGVGRFSLFRGEGLGYSGAPVSVLTKVLIYTVGTMADHAVFVYLIIALENRRRTGRLNRPLMSGIMLTFVAYKTLTGSKAGLYYPILFWFCWKLAAEGDFRIRWKRFLAAACVLTALGPLVFYAGTITRLTLYYGAQRRVLDIKDVSEIAEVASQNRFDYTWQFASVTRRMSALDTVVLMVNHSGPNPERYVTWESVGKAFLDFFIPGRYFPDVLPSSRMWQVIYGGETRKEAEEIYNTPIFSIWGLTFFFWGWAGGISMLFVISWLVGLVYSRMSRCRGQFGYLLKAWWIYSWHLIIINLGLEDTAFEIVQTFVKMAIALVLVLGLQAVPQLTGKPRGGSSLPAEYKQRTSA